MEVEEYIETWKSRGIDSLKTYFDMMVNREFADDVEFTSKFSKDKINYSNFWKASDIYFGFDPVCSSVETASKRPSFDPKHCVEGCNDANYGLFHMYGMDGWMDCVKYNLEKRKRSFKILEIGPGWGAFKTNYVDKIPGTEYVGFDVVPRFDGAVQVMGKDGTLTDQQVDEYAGRFTAAVRFNVFQHLHKDQIERYLGQIHKMLVTHEYCGTVLQFCYSNTMQKQTFHYGQIVDLPTYDEIMDMLKGKFKVVFEARYPNVFPTVCFLLDKIR